MIASITLALLLTFMPSQSVEFVLKNDSPDPITLIVPGAMDPILAPKSKSYVRLEVGQKVYFYPQGAERVTENRVYLFTVDTEFLNTTVKVDDLIKKRMKEVNKE